jgi:hypothetical protein
MIFRRGIFWCGSAPGWSTAARQCRHGIVAARGFQSEGTRGGAREVTTLHPMVRTWAIDI